MVNKDLFRQQVFEARIAVEAQFGRPAAITPPAWSTLIIGLSFFLLVSLFFALKVDFSRKETVRGRLQFSQAEARLQAEQSGIITDLFVQNGERVQRGDPLVEIESETYLRDGQRVSDLALGQIEAELRAVNERLQAAERSAVLIRRGLTQRRTSLENRLVASASRHKTLNDRFDAAGQRYRQAQSYLEEGLISQVGVDAREVEYNRVESELLDLSREIELDRDELASIVVNIEQSETDFAQTRTDIEQQIVQLNGQKKDASSGAWRQRVASIDGLVTGLQVRKGEPVRQGKLLMAIVPENSKLFAEIFLPSRAIAFVQQGQEVKLRYDALPYENFGVEKGIVTSVSSTAFLASDLDISSQNEGLFYRVEVGLLAQTVDAFGQPIRLQSGMELSADIVLEKRKLLNWVLSSFNR